MNCEKSHFLKTSESWTPRLQWLIFAIYVSLTHHQLIDGGKPGITRISLILKQILMMTKKTNDVESWYLHFIDINAWWLLSISSLLHASLFRVHLLIVFKLISTINNIHIHIHSVTRLNIIIIEVNHIHCHVSLVLNFIGFTVTYIHSENWDTNVKTFNSRVG